MESDNKRKKDRWILVVAILLLILIVSFPMLYMGYRTYQNRNQEKRVYVSNLSFMLKKDFKNIKENSNNDNYEYEYKYIDEENNSSCTINIKVESNGKDEDNLKYNSEEELIKDKHSKENIEELIMFDYNEQLWKEFRVRGTDLDLIKEYYVTLKDAKYYIVEYQEIGDSEYCSEANDYLMHSLKIEDN